MIETFILAANKVGVSVYLLLAICTTESNLRNVNNFDDPNGGSHGVCQLNLHTARLFRKHVDKLALQQVPLNVEIAALYIKQLESKYHSIEEVVSAYNAGRPIQGNQRYVNKVLVVMENIYGQD